MACFNFQALSFLQDLQGRLDGIMFVVACDDLVTGSKIQTQQGPAAAHGGVVGEANIVFADPQEPGNLRAVQLLVFAGH